MTTLHESDPKFAALGISKFKCFVVDTTKAASSTVDAEQRQLPRASFRRGLTGPGSVPQSHTGWDGKPRSEGVHEDRPRWSAHAGFARGVLLIAKSTRDRSVRALSECARTTELHHAAEW